MTSWTASNGLLYQIFPTFWLGKAGRLPRTPELREWKGGISTRAAVNSSWWAAGGTRPADTAAARGCAHTLNSQSRKYRSLCKIYLLITCIFHNTESDACWVTRTKAATWGELQRKCSYISSTHSHECSLRQNRTRQWLTAGIYPTLHFILTFKGRMIIIHYSMHLELQIVLTFIQRKTKNSAMKKTRSILLHDNKPKSLNLIFNFLLDNPFVFQNLCHLWITWERNTAWIISLPFLMTTF